MRSPIIHVIAAVNRECAWLDEYRQLEKQHRGLVELSECRSPTNAIAALRKESEIAVLDAHGYRPFGVIGNGWTISLLDDEVCFGAKTAVVLGCCRTLSDPVVKGRIEAKCAGKVLMGGTGAVQSRDSRKLVMALCDDPRLSGLTGVGDAFSVLTSATDRLRASMPKWSERWSEPKPAIEAGWLGYGNSSTEP
ncbi:hypothetical protein QM646_17430 [Rhodococcus erythropolis]|nr:hypothetical protein [Rhodococcus erythropolis]